MADTIRLTIPAGDRYREVASLVLGGVGTRADLSFERMDDLQLAVLSLLDAAHGLEVGVEVHLDDARVSVTVGPLREDVEADSGLERVVGRLADTYEVRRADEGCEAVVTLERSRARPGVTTA